MRNFKRAPQGIAVVRPGSVASFKPSFRGQRRACALISRLREKRAIRMVQANMNAPLTFVGCASLRPHHAASRMQAMHCGEGRLRHEVRTRC